ncbi:MAG TPA: FYVE zinc finger domain-containing protein [Thermoanaerobaculia bacterium]|nr:FYVE zinc finger domain-containing protein [Thermoanaerobaculia bacterium]
MPTLTAIAIHTLGALQNAIRGTGHNNNLACWNWAFTGFAGTAVWPEHMFDFVAMRSDAAALAQVPDNQGRAWFRQGPNLQALTTIRDTFANDVADNPQAATTAAVAAVMELAVDANGHTRTPGPTNYRLWIYYKAGEVMPSFEHAWLDVNGTCIEMFPTMTDVQIYPGHQPLHGKLTWDTYLTGFHQRQIDKIIEVFRDRAAQLVLNPRIPPGRQAWVQDDQRLQCGFCAKTFGVLTRRHHCRRCGEIFCDACSQGRRIVNQPSTRPGEQNVLVSADRVRVCVRCTPP